jgi:hypothetical protein
MNTSIVIPLASNGFGSRYNNIELKYCLRSIENHLFGYGDIFLIGHLPKWVKNVIHIPATDEDRTWWKERNIYRKILLACEDPRVSEDFLFMNDDHFLLKDYVAREFPVYYDGCVSDQRDRDDQYGVSVQNTIRAMRAAGYRDEWNYDVHAPIVYNKILFKQMPGVPWEDRYGYCIKSLYQNWWGLVGVHYPDLKINQPLPGQRINELITGRHWFSIGNKALDMGSGMVGVLEELYQKKSLYEK